MTDRPDLYCISCGNKLPAHPQAINVSDRRKGLSGTWQLVDCKNCGVISMAPMPTDEQLKDYYAAYSNNDRVDLTHRAGTDYPRIRKLFHQLSGDVDPRDFVVVPPGARVLDYGCGQASYLYDFHDRGIAISGAEIASHLVEVSRNHGLDVRKVNNFSQIPFEDESFDIVYLMQVFEHLRDPHRSMQELGRVLKHDGILYLALPNAASIWRKVFGQNWVTGWFPPFHLFCYHRDSLARIAGEHGFEVVKSWSSTPEAWFRLNLKACLYPNENKLERRLTWLDRFPIRYIIMVVLRVVELLFHERDCLVVKLKKRS